MEQSFFKTHNMDNNPTTSSSNHTSQPPQTNNDDDDNDNDNDNDDDDAVPNKPQQTNNDVDVDDAVPSNKLCQEAASVVFALYTLYQTSPLPTPPPVPPPPSTTNAVTNNKFSVVKVVDTERWTTLPLSIHDPENPKKWQRAKLVACPNGPTDATTNKLPNVPHLATCQRIENIVT
eukprot:scaffold120431_cov56-Attheya_sp.AAC.3